MQKEIVRKFMMLIAVLACFGFFYFIREKIAEGYMEEAAKVRSRGNESAALEQLAFAGALNEQRGAQAHLERAEIMLSRKDFDGAQSELSRALGKGDDARVYASLGQIENMRGDYTKAEEYYKKAYELQGGKELLLTRARNLMRGQEGDLAEKLLEESQKSVPDPDVAYYLGLIRADSGNYSAQDFADVKNGEHEKEAGILEDFFRSGAFARFDSDYALVSRAQLFCRIGATEIALADLDKVMVHNGKYRDAYFVQGMAYADAGDFEKAEKAFIKSLGLDPDHEESLYGLSNVYEAMGDKTRAAEYAKRAEALGD